MMKIEVTTLSNVMEYFSESKSSPTVKSLNLSAENKKNPSFI